MSSGCVTCLCLHVCPSNKINVCNCLADEEMREAKTPSAVTKKFHNFSLYTVQFGLPLLHLVHIQIKICGLFLTGSSTDGVKPST